MNYEEMYYRLKAQLLDIVKDDKDVIKAIETMERENQVSQEEKDHESQVKIMEFARQNRKI